MTATIQVLLLASVKSFYKANWRELNSNVGQGIELPEPKKRTPKLQDIVELDDVMTSHRDRAILWFLESSPLRRGTLTMLKWKDLKSTELMLKQLREEAKGQVSRTPEEDVEIAKKVPYYFVIESARLKGGGKGRYKGVRHVGFLHSFAVKKLERYKQELKELNIAVTDDSWIFVTYAHNWATGKGNQLQVVSFDEASFLAWQDLDKKRFSAQDMRDLLQTALENAKVNPNIASPLLGHKVKGVDKHYSNHDIDEFLRSYLDALPWLVPQTVEQVKAETEKKLEEDKKQINEVKYQNNSLKQEVNGLHERDKARDKEIADLGAMMQRLSDSQRKTIEAQMRKSREEAEERENDENAKRLSQTTPEEEETTRANLKKLPQIIEEDKKRQKEEAEKLKGLNKSNS